MVVVVGFHIARVVGAGKHGKELHGAFYFSVCFAWIPARRGISPPCGLFGALQAILVLSCACRLPAFPTCRVQGSPRGDGSRRRRPRVWRPSSRIGSGTTLKPACPPCVRPYGSRRMPGNAGKRRERGPETRRAAEHAPEGAVRGTPKNAPERRKTPENARRTAANAPKRRKPPPQGPPENAGKRRRTPQSARKRRRTPENAGERRRTPRNAGKRRERGPETR